MSISYFEGIPAIPISQGEFSFYVFKIKAKKLLSIAYTSERTKENRIGIQRGLRKDRLISIGKYLQGKISGQPILPNTIIVSHSNDSYYEDGKIHIANKELSEAFVIDGQHRLWSFQEEFSGTVDIEILVSAFIELGDDKKALIFKTINGEQRKINPSLVYDLIPMLREKNWVEFENWRSQEIVDILNSDPSSPWANRISMVGEPNKIISQSSFITAIKKLFKKGHIFNSSYAAQELIEGITEEKLLVEFFNAVEDQYNVEWDNREFFLCKYVGVSALLNLLEIIIEDLRAKHVELANNTGLLLTQQDFVPYILKLKEYRFSAKEAKANGYTYVGEGGVNDLFKKIAALVFPSND